jgi:fumarate reductase subunit C
MNEYTVIAIFIVWYVLALIVSETIGKKKKLGVEWSFFLSFILSPLVGYFITRFGTDKQKG